MPGVEGDGGEMPLVHSLEYTRDTAEMQPICARIRVETEEEEMIEISRDTPEIQPRCS